MEISGRKIKNIVIISRKKEKTFFLYFVEFNFLTQNLKHFFYFRRELLELEKFLTFPGKKTFLPQS